MLSTIHVTDVLDFRLLVGILPCLLHVHILMTFKPDFKLASSVSKEDNKIHKNIPVEQDSTQRLFEIFAEAGNDLFQDVQTGGTLAPMWPLINKIVVQN